MRFILASASPARLETLRKAGVHPTPIVSGVDESLITAPTAAEEVQLLAKAKARAVAEMGREQGWLEADALIGSTPTLIVGCDSMFELGGTVYGKPPSIEAAKERAKLMRGQTGTLYTGHHVIHIDGYALNELTDVAATEVTMGQISDEEIDAYVATGEPLQVAGGFTIDGLGGPFIESLKGDPHNVVGISLPLLRRMLLTLDIAWPTLWED
ncbi:MAG: Maf-like protein [Propionibacteriaceae bacterium]|jgi:septum formation protein|nr:Maf-like protein [Propionibacteriaceae bacterium]